ncbi:MAG: 1-acyl-sn-glycerol-3-phosphate acyltransferase [Crocinitomicaceae bacterium]|nr:1-acyl-sn-glycerol-3-phosphate acyltransferase [Crocinitomicaceae bacterium]
MRNTFANILWFPINVIQILLLLVITVIAGILGPLLLLFFRDPRPAILIVSHYFWSPLLFLICMVKFRTKGRENIDKSQQYIYISNHESLTDIAAICLAITVPLFFVAKQELAKVPVVGTYIKTMGMIFVDRKNKDRAMESMKRAIVLIQSGSNVITFPEGTRSKTGKLMLFKRGSFVIAKEGNIGVVPVAIRGTRKVLPSGSFFIRPGKVEVIIGEPVKAETFSHLSSEETASFFRGKIEAMLK